MMAPYCSNHPTACTCPSCNAWAFSGAITNYTGTTFYLPPGPSLEDIKRINWENHYDAVGRSRELARLPDAPQRRPRVVPRPYSSARMVHAQRCPMRRPRLSLLERARAVVL